ncbi:MAG: hypothetical protein KatS3mg024_1486 [Armatimonadota bacterium]|nr:MAG: hypothetical protein KatS3mg024_1486 [Armatimonadota bacterium]
MTPRVSVIMAAHNAGRFVAEAVESILRQTTPDWELIVVDDASTDDTPEVLRRFDDPRISILRNDENSGPAVSRNRALQAAQGEYVAILDADDVALPQRLEKQVRFLDGHGEVSAVGSWAEKIDETGRVLEHWKTPIHPAQLDFVMTHTCPLLHPSATARTDAVRSIGGYDPAYPCAQDYDLWVRLALQGHGFACVPEILIRYRSSPGQISTARRAEQARYATRAAERYVEAKLGWAPGAPQMAAYRAILDGASPFPPDLDLDEGLATLRKIFRGFSEHLPADARAAVRAYIRDRALVTAALSRRSSPATCMRLARAMMGPLLGGTLDWRVWMLLVSAARHGTLQRVRGKAILGDGE